MKPRLPVFCFGTSLLLATVVLGQNIPTGTLTGTITDGKAPLPGATVAVASPNLQGTRTATSAINGDYVLELLPPGLYTVKFEFQGFQTVDTMVKISAAQTSTVDAVMLLAKVAEEITVAGNLETISTTATSASTQPAKFVQTLPVNRDVFSYVDLTPGTVRLGSLQEQIAGAITTENLYLINGAAAGINMAGNLYLLYIEDAIQETTTTISNVSAEYGRFTGGVVNMLTRSGGNEFHGSLRLNLTNPKWTAPTPLTIERTDEIDRLWEGTLGGYILKDTLWFFLGGRNTSQTTSLQTYPPVSIPYDQRIGDDRYEGKLTLSLTPSHRVTGSYLNWQSDRENYHFPVPTYDLSNNYDESLPQDIVALNYSGVLSNTFFVEGQYSARHQSLQDEGSKYTDVERGTPVVDMSTGAWYNSSFFCAVCPDSVEKRHNSDAFLRASWFLSTAKAGSHDVRIGVDLFDDMRLNNNWQSGTGYFLYARTVNIVGTGTSARYYPVILPDYSIIEYLPIFQLSKGSHLKTDSAFVNDVWRLNGALTFNLGVRFDKNDGADASGTKVVRDSKWSPRVSLTWDPKGDGDTQVVLGYGEYVAAIATTVADSQSVGGQPADYGLVYEGPPINANGNEVETHGALRQVFAWLDSIGGVLANPQLWHWAYVSGYQTFIGDNLKSPSTTEWTAGISKRLGSHGIVRLDYLDKTWTDLYSQRLDMTTGHSTDPYGNVYDRNIIENDPNVQRRYQAVLLQADHRAGDRLHIGGSYTWSKLYGTDGQVTTAWPNGLESYPEYRDLAWYAPKGYLAGDRRHKVNLYASWDAVSTKALSVNLSVLQRYLSGSPYGAWSGAVQVGPYVANPGYATPPPSTSYAFTAPDAYRTDAIRSTDLAMTFTFKVAGLDLYVNPQIQNVFNNRAVISPDSTVYVNFDNPDGLAPFNPFTDKPKECPQGTTCNLADGLNWQKGPNFGKAIQPTDYQTPRTFLVNVGVRF